MTNRDTKKVVEAAKLLAATFKEAADAARELMELLRPKNEAEGWPLCIDYGDVLCKNPECSCDAEESIILSPFESLDYPPFPRFTAKGLLMAIEHHIEQDKAQKQEGKE